MKTQDYIEAQEAYLERLQRMRQREKEHLSDVDFALFISRFDRLISKVENELERLRVSQRATQSVIHLAACNLIDATPIIGTGNVFYVGSQLSGASAGIFDCHAVVARPARSSIFSDSTSLEIYPSQLFTNTVEVFNMNPAVCRPAQFSTPRMARLASTR